MATRSTTRIYHFINNNCASFHLQWRENLLKHQRVSKYYENDCMLWVRRYIYVTGGFQHGIEIVSEKCSILRIFLVKLSLITQLFDGYVLDPYGFMICIQHDNRFDCLVLVYAFIYPILVKCGWIGQNKIGKSKKTIIRIAEEWFQFCKGKIRQRWWGKQAGYRDGRYRDGRQIIFHDWSKGTICFLNLRIPN